MSGGDRDRRSEQPRVKVTDKRRFAQDENAASAAEAGGAAPRDDSPGASSVESSEAVVAAARREAAEYREHLQRLQAEFDNYRKRVLKEQTQAIDRAAEPVIRRLLEVLDDFEL